MNNYYPEGWLIASPENNSALKNIFSLRTAVSQGKILEARVTVCDNEHNLIVDLPCPECPKGIIPRFEGAVGIEDGSTKDIALITKVNKPVCFKILKLIKNPDGIFTAILSRRAAQEECYENYISSLQNGDIIPARVTHLEQFGAFVDVGCGIPSLIPIDSISVSRISHPSDRFSQFQDIRVIIKGTNGNKLLLSHKELLGTWEENADLFSCGETVSGIVRSVEDYGVFVELAPNLAGLAEPKENIHAGDNASVYIKSIIPEKMKIKLIIVDVFKEQRTKQPLNYFYSGEHISHWIYSSPNSGKLIESYFC